MVNIPDYFRTYQMYQRFNSMASILYYWHSDEFYQCCLILFLYASPRIHRIILGFGSIPPFSRFNCFVPLTSVFRFRWYLASNPTHLLISTNVDNRYQFNFGSLQLSPTIDWFTHTTHNMPYSFSLVPHLSTIPFHLPTWAYSDLIRYTYIAQPQTWTTEVKRTGRQVMCKALIRAYETISYVVYHCCTSVTLFSKRQGISFLKLLKYLARKLKNNPSPSRASFKELIGASQRTICFKRLGQPLTWTLHDSSCLSIVDTVILLIHIYRAWGSFCGCADGCAGEDREIARYSGEEKSPLSRVLLAVVMFWRLYGFQCLERCSWHVALFGRYLMFMMSMKFKLRMTIDELFGADLACGNSSQTLQTYDFFFNNPKGSTYALMVNQTLG